MGLMSDIQPPTYGEQIGWLIKREAATAPEEGLALDLDKGAEMGVETIHVERCNKVGWQCTLFAAGPAPNSVVGQGETPARAIDAAHRRLFGLRGLE